ncbi:MAG TPA: methyltransferase domain-containing protein [Bryobacteraceae bacterium]|nr:methyltransferase domain-containing protein [Bryobacteraceae bacterium]
MSDNAADYRARIYERYASNFQSAPEVFDRLAARRWGRSYRYYLRGWLPSSRDARILDVACGGGKLLQFFIDAGYRDVHGIDLSSEQVMLARQVTPHVVQANALDFLADHPARFDLITGLDIIEHFRKEEILTFLDLCYAALKPGGRLVLQTPNAESPWSMHYRYGDLTHELAFNPNALTRLLSLVGFTATEARETGPVPWGYSTPSTLRWLAWQLIRAGLKLWNLAETGDAGSGVLTRVFLVCATRGTQEVCS